MSFKDSPLYQFGEFRLDVHDRRLLKQEEEIPLTRKAFDILLELVRAKGRVVQRDELIGRVWPDSFVEEGNLKVTIFHLRKALNDDPAHPSLIQTVPRRGYRFLADVVAVSESEATTAQRSNQISSIAVLPFKTMGVADDDYLGFGLADALVIKLSQIKEIVVRPTSAVRRYVGSERNSLEIGRELNVEAVLEGYIYRAADRIRVTAQLVTIRNEVPLWADRFDQHVTDIFEIEDSISEQVAQALAFKLTGSDKDRLTRRYTDNFEAYQLYLKGRYHWAKRIASATRVAAEQFKAAIDLDPSYTLAYAGFADCYAQLGWLRLLAPSEAFTVAKAAAVRALELDPLLAEAHASLAWIQLLFDLDFVSAEARFKRSLELNPNYSVARMWYGVFLITRSRFAEAVAEVSEALKLDPLSPIINAVAGWPFYFMRDYTQAIDRYRKAIDLEPNSLPAHYLLAATYAQANRGDKAISHMQRALELDNSSFTLLGLAEAYAVAGRVDEAEKALEELEQTRKGQYISPYDEAGVYLRLGNHERALRLLEETVGDQSVWRIFLPLDPKFDVLCPSERFKKLLAGMHL